MEFIHSDWISNLSNIASISILFYRKIDLMNIGFRLPVEICFDYGNTINEASSKLFYFLVELKL